MATTIFDHVWYLPGENRWRDMNLLAFRDSGTLTIGQDGLVFQGMKEKVVVKAIRRVSTARQGRDFVNSWVRIEYGDASSPSTAFFADGSWLGWGGIFGGTRRILTAIQNAQ